MKLDFKIPEIGKLKKTHILMGVFLLLLLLVDFRLIIIPAFDNLRSLNPQIRRLRSNINEARQDIARLDDLKNHYAYLKSQMQNLESNIIESGQTPMLLRDISKKAKSLNVKIMQIQPIYEQEKRKQSDDLSLSAYTPLVISIEARCSYHQLGKFLNQVESADTFVKVLRLDISPTGRSDLVHSVRLALGTYILEE